VPVIELLNISARCNRAVALFQFWNRASEFGVIDVTIFFLSLCLVSFNAKLRYYGKSVNFYAFKIPCCPKIVTDSKNL
jgi:hypothetical protein